MLQLIKTAYLISINRCFYNFMKAKHITISKILAVALVSILSIYILIGNIFHGKFFALSPQINLGLDIKGGSQLLLTVDFDATMREKYRSLLPEIKDVLLKQKLRLRSSTVTDGGLLIDISSMHQAGHDELQKAISGVDVDMRVMQNADSTFTVYYDSKVIAELKNRIIEQSLKIVRSRIDTTGTKEISLQRSGTSNIILQVPGMDDPQRLKRILGKTAKLSFHLMDEKQPFAPNATIGNDDIMSLTAYDGRQGIYYNVKRFAEISGESLVDAKASFENFKTAIVFRLNGIGSKRFGEITKENIGKPFAIVLDGKVLMAPVINEPIMGGSGVITSSFSMEEATEVSQMLRSGALPAPIKVIEERTIGPSLGSNAINVAKIAGSIGILLVAAFMISYYGRLGIIASIAILLNLSTAVACMALFGATLTLSGIAGLILTLGMSVDANVLIYERMRDEVGSGNNDNKTIISRGFAGAWTAILDSNITTILSAMALVVFGSGFIRGFAVSLIIGIICSLFSAVLFTKMATEIMFRSSKTRIIKA